VTNPSLPWSTAPSGFVCPLVTKQKIDIEHRRGTDVEREIRRSSSIHPLRFHLDEQTTPTGVFIHATNKGECYFGRAIGCSSVNVRQRSFVITKMCKDEISQLLDQLCESNIQLEQQIKCLSMQGK